MSEQQPGQTGASGEISDDFQVEVSATDLHRPEDPATRTDLGARHGNTPASPFASHLTHRARALRAGGIAGAVLLAIVVVAGGLPATRNSATQFLAGLRPTPTATLIPGSNAYFLLPNPPGTTILLDGHALASPPLPGDPHPLLLSPGTHTLAWRNMLYPFQPLSCRISVPRARRDTCQLLQPYQVPPLANGAPVTAPIIADRLSLSALPGTQSAALTATIQAALQSMTATAAIAPGDHYLDASGGAVAIAARPFTAVFQVRPTTDPFADPCAFGETGGTCPLLGQTCESLCTLPNPGLRGAGPPSRWIVGTSVQVVWSYIASDGSIIQRDVQALGYGVETALLAVSWDGTTWQAQPLLGERGAAPSSADLVCAAAWQPFYGSTAVSYLFYPDASYSVTVQYASGTRVSDGCVIRMANSGQTTAPLIPGDGTALFLERCGVLLAASDAAHTLWPDLPRANATERADARELASALGNP